MQGCGNDYIYIDCFEQTVTNCEKIAIALSDRHFGVGGDGVIFICPSEIADCEMRMFNLDGSEGNMCGNGIRCVAKYMYERRGFKGENIKVATKSGTKILTPTIENSCLKAIGVNMGKPDFCAKSIPALYKENEMINAEISVNNAIYRVTCLSMGNPHCVILTEDTENSEVEEIGKAINSSDIFRDGVNVEFVEIQDSKRIKMRVFERGSGETLSCGTGACASVAALERLGLLPKNETITVELLGGCLEVTRTDKGIILSGEAEFVFDGEVDFNGED